MKYLFLILLSIIVFPLLAVVVPYSSLSPSQQSMVMPDLDGRVLCTQDFLDSTPDPAELRVLPELAEGWPLTYTVSNCFKGAIYTNMDADEDLELLFGVGMKIVAHNLDGSTVAGWPQQLGYYIWSSPACGDIDGDGEDEIVACSRNSTSGNIGVLYAFEKSGTAVEGFPVTLAGGGTMNACLADLDGDEDLEICVNVRNAPNGWTYVFDGDGSVFPGWPQQLDTFPGSGISVGDITGDDIPEVIGLSYNSLYAFDTAGNVLDGFPVSEAGFTYSYSQPILADIDGDGLREIIYGGCSTGGAVFAVNNDGTYADGWFQAVDNWIFANPALGDIDGDGELDIVIGDQVSSGTPINHIYAWHGDGTALNGFPAGPTNAIYAQAGIADLDGDEQPEIMIDDNVFGNGYECYNNDGSHCTDWPLPCGTGWDSITMQMTPVFGDFDNDGLLEIAGAATGFTTYVVECCLWNTESPWNEDIAYMPLDGCNIQHTGLYPQELLPPPPVAPSECQAELFDYNDALVSWVMEDAGQTGFNIYCCGELLAEIFDPLQREYYHYALNSGEYDYYVTALYNGLESDPSPVAIVNVNLLPPENLIWDTSCGIIYLYWNSPAAQRALTGYNIYRDGVVIATTVDTAYVDSGLSEDTYEYCLTAIYSDSLESSPCEIVEIYVTPVTEDNAPGWDINLTNYPNPFNPSTMISFQLEEPASAKLQIYNCMGQLIRTFPRNAYPAGISCLEWDGNTDEQLPAASGIYFIRLSVGENTISSKMLLLK
ncbi:MAG: T9SS type A sorting domain-containing protein [Candidatus Cloacimonetes bacterium]|nr:T9SS type A sorting domain-containing protein [Candidatus Cloacimonadota bacterium]